MYLYKVSNKHMSLEQALIAKGHSIETAARVIEEARASSNAAYILLYWGLSERNAEKYAEVL